MITWPSAIPIGSCGPAIRWPNVATVDQWRKYLFKAGVLDENASNPRQPFKRIKDALTEKEFIREWNDLLWIVAND